MFSNILYFSGLSTMNFDITGAQLRDKIILHSNELVFQKNPTWYNRETATNEELTNWFYVNEYQYLVQALASRKSRSTPPETLFTLNT